MSDRADSRTCVPVPADTGPGAPAFDAGELARAVVERLPNMVFVKDAVDLRFVLLNHAAETLLGCRREDLLGRTDFDVFPRAEAEFFTAKDREALASGEMVDIPAEPIATATRGIRHLRTLKVRLCDERGEPRYLLGISEDVTERRELEQRLELARRLEAVGTLAGGLAHDFGNLLGSIIGNAELARAASADAAVIRRLDRVLQAAGRARALVDELLVYHQREDIRLQPVDLLPLVREAIDLARAGLPAGVAVALHAEPPLPSIVADPDQLHRVIVNLVTNAVHAVEPDGGTVTVDLGHDGDGVRLSVRDDGCGMDAATMARIFDPFFTTRPRGRGTGLGLAAVHAIVERHRGRIDVGSEPGRGTIVDVRLPFDPAAAG